MNRYVCGLAAVKTHRCDSMNGCVQSYTYRTIPRV